MGRISRGFLAAAGFFWANAGVLAQEAETGLTGSLAQIARRGAVIVAARDDAAPFAFKNRAGREVGYSIDLCAAIVETIADRLGRKDLRIDYLPVSAENRLTAVAEGRADLECGATTMTAGRARQVAFSPLIFVTGARLLVAWGMTSKAGARRDVHWRDVHDLAGKTIAVTAGTTAVTALKRLNEKFALGVTLIESPDHDSAVRLLEDGKVDAFAADEVLLASIIAGDPARDRLQIVGEFLSYEPYGLVYRRNDPAMTEAVEAAFQKLAASHELDAIYRRWFIDRLPNGQALKIPMSPQLEQAFEALRGGAPAEGL